MDYVSEEVQEVLAEAPPDISQEMPETPEMSPEMPEMPELPPETPQKPTRAPRIRKVRVAPAREASPPPKPDHAFWAERLRSHRANERAAKDERYGNLRIG
jgi:hypothetical protein